MLSIVSTSKMSKIFFEAEYDNFIDRKMTNYIIRIKNKFIYYDFSRKNSSAHIHIVFK